MTKYYSRPEFYEMVWTKPITHWAKEFRLSDVALHKICRKHGIPTPPPGWWARQSSGQQVERIPLPAVDNSSSAEIAIVSNDAWKEAQNLAEARENARIEASIPSLQPSTMAVKIIEQTIRQLRQCKTDERGLVRSNGNSVISCTVAPQSVDRLVVALPSIFAAAGVQGFDVRAGKISAAFFNSGVEIGFSIAEITKRVPHVLTQEELRRQADYEEDKRKQRRRNGIDEFLWPPSFPEWDIQPTGQLNLELEHVYVVDGSSPRRSFKDGKTRRLETMAGDIAVGLAVIATAKVARQRHFQEEERKRETERSRREAVARKKFIEEKRQKGLQSILSEIDELDRLRGFMAKLLAERLELHSPRLTTFLAWASENLRKREERLMAEALEARFEEERLFGDDDDAGFKPQVGYF